MLAAIILMLILLWIMGYVQFGSFTIPNPTLFVFNGQPIKVFTILILLVIMWAIEALPSPIRQIVMVVLLLWVLATLGFIMIPNLSSLLILALIIGLALSLFTR